MASLTPTTSGPIPSTTDGNLGPEQTSPRANQYRQFWGGGLPNDVWLRVLDHLCSHCQPGATLRLDSVFTKARKRKDRTQAPLPVGPRVSLKAMTLTCRLFRDLAQKYIGHCVVRRDIENQAFLRTMHARPDLAAGVRQISVASDFEYRGILELCTGIQSLNYIIYTRRRDFDKLSGTHSDLPDVKFGYTNLVGKLYRLRHLHLLPPNKYFLVDLTRGRLWLEALMKTAPELRTLILQEFVDIRFTDYRETFCLPQYLFSQRDRSLGYAGLPENKVTRLDLRNTWFRYHTLDQLLRNFKHLRDFRFSFTRPQGPIVDEARLVHLVDGQDVLTLLEPLKDQLEVLDLDFEGYQSRRTVLGIFRPVTSLAGFTALKTLRLSTWSIMPTRLDRLAANPIAKEFLAEMLPCRSLEALQIDGFGDMMMHSMCELARRKNLGEFPRLKHVRMLGQSSFGLYYCNFPGALWQFEQYHDLDRFIPQKHRWRASVAVTESDPVVEAEARSLFREAGVRFDTFAVFWRARAWDGENELSNDEITAVFVQPCAEGCQNTNCGDPEKWYGLLGGP